MKSCTHMQWCTHAHCHTLTYFCLGLYTKREDSMTSAALPVHGRGGHSSVQPTSVKDLIQQHRMIYRVQTYGYIQYIHA